MYSKHFIFYYGLKCTILTKFLNKNIFSNFLVKYSSASSQSKKIRKEVNVEILDENINYNHFHDSMKKQNKEILKQANHIKHLKIVNVDKDILKIEVVKLKLLKKTFEELEEGLQSFETFEKHAMSRFVNSLYLFSPSNNLYEPIAGFYDYDPTGCRILENIHKEWQKHFVNKEKMLMIKCPSITSQAVLRASGHVNKFTNFMIQDSGSTEKFRLDQIIKNALENILSDKICLEVVKKEAKDCLPILEGMSLEELLQVVRKFEIKSVSGKDLVNPAEYNLMFPVEVGHHGLKVFLRPESSQGIFIKFNKLLAANQNCFPFSCAQFATVFRNEIDPGCGLLRLREFNIAEIEQFHYPSETKCDKLHKVASTKLWLYSSCNQLEGKHPQLLEIGTAVKDGLIENEYQAYYMARIQTFLEKIGICSNKLRFRQHFKDELPHYACSCWDAECSTSFGWVECVSCSDRGQYDLKQHSLASGNSITVNKILKTSGVSVLTPILDSEEIMRKYENEFDQIIEKLSQLSPHETNELKKAIDQNRNYTLDEFIIYKEMVKSFEMKETKTEKVIPAVVEPSFGMDRIFLILMEHTFKLRENKSRGFLSLPAVIAPYKVAVLPLLDTPEFIEVVAKIENELDEIGISSAPIGKADVGIGKLYVKLDQIGVPFAVTVDQDTLVKTPQTVTIRERDSMQQIRISIDEIPSVIRRLSEGLTTWDDILKLFKKFIYNKN